MNLVFAWWWMFAALPLILLLLFLPVVRGVVAAVYVPFKRIAPAAGATPGQWLSRILLVLTWVLLVVAVSRPQLASDEVIDNRFVRNLVLSIDISESMLREDMQVNGRLVNRLEALKVALDRFIAKRKGDQLALVVFADNAYVQSPLSYDTDAIATLVDELVIGLAGKRTSIGDALVLAIKVIENNPVADRHNSSIVLLSDGENTWGSVSPQDAMQLAQERGIVVHTIGFGSNRFGHELDESTLRAIAQQTKGKFFRATNTGELSKVYAAIDKLNQVKIDTYAYKKHKEIYYWPLLGALFTAMMAILGLGGASFTRA